ncbi:MAG TPA: 5'-methylthioadenosine/S-adenosylhomocysteine nucleosidase [Rhizomicrobium sp.]|nr:5'-methylthioadenosine/S-adenosylhomocysteine nucleosidase [Rhizomicrobium sp.]
MRALRFDQSRLSDEEALELAKLFAEHQQTALERYSTGIVTALPVEMAALESCFDEVKDIEMRGVKYKVATASIKGSNQKRSSAIIKQASEAGNNLAAVCAADMLSSFPNIEELMLVGIAGGVPYPENAEKHVRLGDIVVSDQQGVTQYDIGRQYKDYFEEKQRGRPPSAKLLDRVNELTTLELKGVKSWEAHIDELQLRLAWDRPADQLDVLYRGDGSTKIHPHPGDESRQPGRPKVFRGKIGSANLVLKSSDHRRKLRERHGVIAVEMEGSGIADAAWMHRVGYLVVRGICDYADGRKNDTWHRYAAIVAAAYAKAILEIL